MMDPVLLSAQIDALDPEWISVPDVMSFKDLSQEEVERRAGLAGFLLPKQSNSTRAAITEDQQKKTLESQAAFVYPKFLNDHALRWAQHNISRHAQDFRFSFTTPGRTRLIPHTDRSRSFLLMYLLDTGGNEVETVFYRRRGSDQLVLPPDSYEHDYQTLDVVHKITVPARTWTLINTSVLHSVENMQSIRFGYHLSFGVFPEDLTLLDPVYL